MNTHNRGRPRSAPPELRANNYRNAEGRYELTNGLKFWHERVVDFLLLNPNAMIVDIARHFQVTPQWVGMLVKSDAFLEYYKERMQKHQSYVTVDIVARMQGLAVQSMEKLSTQLRTKDVSVGQVKDVAELALKSLGYGVRAGVSVNVHGDTNNTQVVIGVSPEGLERARARIAEQRARHTAQLTSGDEVQKQADENYKYVTASLETPPEHVHDARSTANSVDDAVILGGNSEEE